jgi:ABC-type nitrate/sulfonate/bicarbonate transport system substrate-binding protein
LQHFGVNPKEVTILQIGSTPARFAALTAGAVDASIVWFPVTDIAKAQGYNKLYDLREIFPEWPYETFAARESWIAKEKDQVVKFLRAYQRGVKHTLENKEDAIKAIRICEDNPACLCHEEYRSSSR